MSDDPVDLSDPDLYADGDPHAVWRRLRREAPVYFNREPDGAGFWALTGYDDCLRVYRDAEAFSSAKGILLGRAQRGGDPAGGRTLPLTDPPRHRKLRALVNRWFTPRAVAALEPAIRDHARALVTSAVPAGRCDFVRDVVAPIPLAVICRLLGVPKADAPAMLALTTRAFGGQDPRARSTAHQEILLYFLDLAAARRREPQDDIVSVLVHARIGGRGLDDDEVMLNCDNLLVGGTENVRHAAAGGMLALLEHPDEAARWRRGEVESATAVDEILRWTSPASHILRTTRAPVEIGAHPIGAGEAVTMWLPAANRDDRAFAEPDRLDLSRRPNRHLALGQGEHYCLGAGIAKLELTSIFETLWECTEEIALAGPVTRLRSRDVLGIERLPLTLTGRPAADGPA